MLEVHKCLSLVSEVRSQTDADTSVALTVHLIHCGLIRVCDSVLSVDVAVTCSHLEKPSQCYLHEVL